jgi:putative PIN family toxin of toxin-antitoxin system
MLRVVADTNVFISALMFGGLPGSFLDLALLESFTLVTSVALLDEKLRKKFELSPEDADLIRARLEKTAEVVNPEVSLSVISDDPDDDRVLECAVTGRVDYVVSGDRHLLRLVCGHSNNERPSILGINRCRFLISLRSRASLWR